MIGTMRSVFSSARKASGRQLGYVDDGVGMKRSGFVRTLHLEEMMVSSVLAGCRRDPRILPSVRLRGVGRWVGLLAG